MDPIADFGRWLADLDPAFALLLALPFAVAATGFLAVRLDPREKHRARRAASLQRVSGRPAHVR